MINIYQFSGLIKCLDCKGKYRGKSNRGKQIYICSTYSKDSSKCSRYVIEEEFLIYTVEKHLKLKGIRAEGSLGEFINFIEVKNRSYTIFYKDGSKTFISDNEDLGIKVQF